MRRTAAALIALVTAVALAGCATDSADPDTADTPTQDQALGPSVDGPSPADVAALAAVTVSGELGAEPAVSFDRPFEVTAPVARVDVAGDGAALTIGERVTVHYLMVDGDTGETLASTWAAETPEGITVGDPQIVSALNEVLAEQSVGARVLIAVPGVAATADTPAAPAVVMALEIVDIAPSRATGEAVEPPDGLPLVTLADDGRPSIDIAPGTSKPTELVAQPLIKGDGAVIEAGQSITVHYSGWLWDGTPFDSSWESGQPFPTQIGVGQVIPGWDEGLVGQTVGSQVLLVIPPELAYGPEGQGSIPPDATLIFVVDLLGAP